MILENILSLANPETWQHSLELSRSITGAWSGKALGEMPGKRGRGIRKVYLVGHGSSLYNGMVGKAIIEQIAGIPAEAVPAFAFATYVSPALLGQDSLVVGISTSGQTQAVVDALNRARQAAAPTLAITAHAGAPVAQDVDLALLSGGENDMLSVKTSSYVLALIPLFNLAMWLAGSENNIRTYWEAQIISAAASAARFLTTQREQMQNLARTFAHAEHVIVLGAGANQGTAQEGALKVVEMAKLHAAAHELENFFHGRLREADQSNPTFFIAPRGKASRRVLDFLTVMHHIQSPVVVLTDVVTPDMAQLADHVIQIQSATSLDELATPLVYVLPLYLFGYEMARQRGYDPNARRYNLTPQNVHYGDQL